MKTMKILILSKNSLLYSTQSLIGAAQKRGHIVQVADHLTCNLVIEKNILKTYIGDIDAKHFDAVIPRIGASATSYGAYVVRQLESSGIFSTVSADALMKARDKFYCMQLLAHHGMPVPKTGIAASDLYAKMIYEKVAKQKAVVKLLSSTQGLGVILTESASQGTSIIEGFHRVSQDVLVQEFIADAKGADIRAFVVNGQVVGSMLRQAVPGEFRSNIHRGASSEIITLTKEENALALKACSVLGLHIAGVDILRSSKGPLILEVNASPGLEGIEGTTKVDIAGKIIEFVEQSV